MISIIIPSYNQAKYLSDAIDSCLMQTVPCEIIVVDDGSTDESLQIARQYEKDGVKVISQVNKGLASARNTGIMNATGDWIVPLDADDVLIEIYISEVEKRIRDDVDVIAPSLKTFGLAYDDIVLMANPTLEDFKGGNRLGYCAAIRKSVLTEVGGYSPKMRYGYEDLHLWINLLTRGCKIVSIPEVLWFYRIKENSMIHEAQAHHQELMAQINKDFPQAELNF